MTPDGPALDRLRFATWNVNSLKVRFPALVRFLARTQPDVVCLQETKAADVTTDAREELGALGYEIVHVGTGGYNGVAIASRHRLCAVTASGDFGVEVLDREPRVIAATIEPGGMTAATTPVRIASVYVPHGRAIGHSHYEYKLEFVAALTDRVADRIADHHIVVAGDLNIAATDSDVFHPDAFVGATHVTPAERDALSRLFAVGLEDVDVVRWGPRARRFTWWKPGFGYSRNLGMRIDVIAVDRALAAQLDTTWIDHLERGSDRPS
jgi:exodeoxyribonuclease-3